MQESSSIGADTQIPCQRGSPRDSLPCPNRRFVLVERCPVVICSISAAPFPFFAAPSPFFAETFFATLSCLRIICASTGAKGAVGVSLLSAGAFHAVDSTLVEVAADVPFLFSCLSLFFSCFASAFFGMEGSTVGVQVVGWRVGVSEVGKKVRFEVGGVGTGVTGLKLWDGPASGVD